MEHLDVGVCDGDEAGFFHGDVEEPGAIVVVEVDLTDLTDGGGAGKVFIGNGRVCVVKITPEHDSFIEDAVPVVGFAFAEFYRLCSGNDGFCVFSFERQGQPVQGFRTGAVGIFAVELGGTLRGYRGSAVAKESREPPLGPLRGQRRCCKLCSGGLPGRCGRWRNALLCRRCRGRGRG